MGTAIAEQAGLSLDLFDIPGRARNAAARPDRLFEGNGILGDNFRYVAEDVLADLYEVFRAADRQHRICEAERRRRSDQIRLDRAVDFLRGRGVQVVRTMLSLGRYWYSVDGALCEGETVIAKAKARGWTG